MGKLVIDEFNHLANKWTLFKGNVAAKYLEEIGNGIDMVFIDSAHYEPGEILDALMILPFLREEAFIGFHDIANQRSINAGRREWAPYLAYNMLRVVRYLPSGKGILSHNIGFIKLEQNQRRFYSDYFRTLSGQWAYLPKQEHLGIIRELFKKYYDEDCQMMFEEAIDFNAKFTKKYPMWIEYNKTKDD